MSAYSEDQKHWIDEIIFRQVYEETVTKYGATNIDTARKIIFHVMELTAEGVPFRRAKSMAITKKKIWPEYQKQFHSLVIKYFKRVATKRENQKRQRRSLYQASTALTTPMMVTEWYKE